MNLEAKSLTKRVKALRKMALAHPDVEEGIACAGTALESSTFKARNKSFLFLRPVEGRLKLDASLEEAAALASRTDGQVRVGSQGWVAFANDESLPLPVLERWIEESYRTVVMSGGANKKPAVKKKPAKKRAAKAKPKAPKRRGKAR